MPVLVWTVTTLRLPTMEDILYPYIVSIDKDYFNISLSFFLSIEDTTTLKLLHRAQYIRGEDQIHKLYWSPYDQDTLAVENFSSRITISITFLQLSPEKDSILHIRHTLFILSMKNLDKSR